MGSSLSFLYFSVCCIKNTLLGLWWPQEAHAYYHPLYLIRKKDNSSLIKVDILKLSFYFLF